jgi:hypothetical protein
MPGENPPHDPNRPGHVAGIGRLLIYEAGFLTGAANGVANDPWQAGGHCLAAIVLAAAAVEAQVGEWVALPANRDKYKDDAPRWRAQSGRTHEVIKAIIRKEGGGDVGSMPWYGRMRCLFALRSHLLHYFPEPRLVGTFPERLEDCIRQGHLVPAGDDAMDWTSRLLTPSVASQAASIAHEAIDGFAAAVGVDGAV